MEAVRRPRLDDMGLSLGKKARLHRLMYNHGLKNGTLMILPIDQGLEHGPLNFFPNPASADPDFAWQLARDGGYNGIAIHYGMARKHMHKWAGKVPLILKLNGKTNVPSDDEALSTCTSSVEDAVAMGADAIGYTLYVGSPRQDEDFLQFQQIREDCDKYGMPIIMWAYPRGSAMNAKGGRNSMYAVDYAARVAMELGADIVKINMPVHSDKDGDQPAPYNTLEWTPQEGVNRAVASAQRTPVLFSGGSKLGDDDLMVKAKMAMDAGAVGLIFGRNMWQRPMKEALAMTKRVQDEVLVHYGD